MKRKSIIIGAAALTLLCCAMILFRNGTGEPEEIGQVPVDNGE